ncbi:MAG: SCO family protein, partial [Vibrionaceae bacterium]|nr:SCO family protein [Vibrionaceae bacterium]
MSKNWSLILVVAFALGFGVKTYLDSQASVESHQAQSDSVTLFGKGNQAVEIFDPQDPRIRVVYFGFTRCPDVCPTSLAM